VQCNIPGVIENIIKGLTNFYLGTWKTKFIGHIKNSTTSQN